MAKSQKSQKKPVSQSRQAAAKVAGAKSKAKAKAKTKAPTKKRGRTVVKAEKPEPKVEPPKDSKVAELREEAEELQEVLRGLGPEEAKALVEKIVPAREEIDILRAERTEEVGRVTDGIKAVNGQIDRKLEQAKDGTVTADKALSVIDKHWTKLGKLETERDQLRKSFNKKIKLAEKRYRDALDGIRQRELPFNEAEAA